MIAMRMRKLAAGMLGGLALMAMPLCGQSAQGTASGPRVMLVSGALQPVSPLGGDVVREIDDPHNGDRWLLVMDVNHPAGPGRLFRAGADRGQLELAARGSATQSGGQSAAPVIHAGDRIIVEENTPVVASRLEAVAMGPALVGAALSVRLRMGGRVLRAVAVASGRARIQEETQP